MLMAKDRGMALHDAVMADIRAIRRGNDLTMVMFEEYLPESPLLARLKENDRIWRRSAAARKGWATRRRMQKARKG